MTVKLTKAILLQLSGILGAGIFVLPHVFQQSNFNFAILGLVLVTLLISQINLFYSDIINNTPGDHQLSGYAHIYLGSVCKFITLINFLLLEIGSLVAYIILFSQFLTHLFPSLSFLQSSTIFFTMAIIFHLNRLKFFGRYYQIIPISAAIIIFILLTSALSLPKLPATIYHPPSFLFFGSLVFALTGFTIIPEVEEILRPHKKYLKIVSLVGLSLAAIFYLLFSYAVSKLSFPHISADAVTGLGINFPILASLLSLLGLFLVFQASLNLLLVFKETFYRDFNLSLQSSYLVSILIFLGCFLLHQISLVTIISLTGSVTLFVSALIICLIRLRISHTPQIIFRTLLVLVVFLIGLISEFF